MSDIPKDSKTPAESPEAKPLEKYSPKPKGIAAMQGLDADISQAEEAKAEAIRQAESALKEGRVDDASKMLKAAAGADNAVVNMKLGQLNAKPDSAAPTVSDPPPPKPPDPHPPPTPASGSKEKERAPNPEKPSSPEGA
jgi:hypothetical protein